MRSTGIFDQSGHNTPRVRYIRKLDRRLISQCQHFVRRYYLTILADDILDSRLPLPLTPAFSLPLSPELNGSSPLIRDDDRLDKAKFRDHRCHTGFSVNGHFYTQHLLSPVVCRKSVLHAASISRSHIMGNKILAFMLIFMFITRGDFIYDYRFRRRMPPRRLFNREGDISFSRAGHSLDAGQRKNTSLGASAPARLPKPAAYMIFRDDFKMPRLLLMVTSAPHAAFQRDDARQAPSPRRIWRRC